MHCLKCGYCCVWCGVAIIEGDRIKLKPGGVVCPHLEFRADVNGAFCKVHEETWFKSTPCYNYGNGEVDPDYSHNRSCVYGNFTMERVLKGSQRNLQLEDCGPFDLKDIA